MKAFVGDTWRDGFLDQHRENDHYRIDVDAYLNLESLNDLYVVPNRSWRVVLNYIRAIGVKAVLRKIVSRTSENSRNEKCISIGLGTVLEHPNNGAFQKSEQVLFLATCHPPCVERLTLPASMIASAVDLNLPTQSGEIIYLPEVSADDLSEQWWNELRGWVTHSGSELPLNMSAIFQEAQRVLETAQWSQAQRLEKNSELQSETTVPEESCGRKSAVLFGYGQYAKTMILPRIKGDLNVCRIHEIDPMQIPTNRSKYTNGWSTRGEVSAEDDYDVYLIASYHHTHAKLAIEGLKKGATVVVEKPLAVNFDQLNELTTTLRDTGGQLFTCFQRRYWRFNEWAREDLMLEGDTPVHYHCIIFEIELPEGHWYLWPNSGSRVISNGCHWLDHFLFMNGFSKVKNSDIKITKSGIANCSVELENGAVCTMVLTDKGSPRIGVQENIEMHSRGRSVKISQGAYLSESADRILRKGKVHQYHCYDTMYKDILSRIKNGEPGDSIRSIEVSAGLILSLGEQIKGICKNVDQAQMLHSSDRPNGGKQNVANFQVH